MPGLDEVKGRYLRVLNEATQKYKDDQNALTNRISEHNVARQVLRDEMAVSERALANYLEFQEFITTQVKEVNTQI